MKAPNGAIPMANSYIPRAQGAALAWLQTFAGGIAADPALYGVTPAEAATLEAVIADFAAAYAAAEDPARRTPVTVAIKDEARRVAEATAAHYYMRIKTSEGITDPDKIALGVRPLNRGRTERTCPASSPALYVLGCVPGGHELACRDSMQGEGMGKPFGAAAVEIFSALAPAPVRDPAEARYRGSATRSRFTVTYDHAADGLVATYFARWTDRRGGTGPWSLPISKRIAA